MTIEILVPDLPESVVDATVITWHKSPGELVRRDEILVEIETDKVVLEISAPEDGILDTLTEEEGATVVSKQLLARLKKPGRKTSDPVKNSPAQSSGTPQKKLPNRAQESSEWLSPAARRFAASKHQNHSTDMGGTSVGSLVTHKNVGACLASRSPSEKGRRHHLMLEGSDSPRYQKRVPMTRLRRRISERLIESKKSTVASTTFNEVNMRSVVEIRKQYKDLFEERHGTRLGMMSFYVKASTEALKRFPEINASIDGEDIVYHNFFDISIAVSTPRGLVTPVLHNCDTLSIAQIENSIKTFASKGRQGKLDVDELTGGNFTITNGGVFGSLLSTPIINPPQSAILGMHEVRDRPIAIRGRVEILPMMYLALSYDHRLIDGRESVGFLATIKQLVEDPVRLLLDV